MSVKDIEKRQVKDSVKFELAKKIRAMLDEARKQYGPTEWDDDGVESEIVELVTAE
jgi:hypothetical protein